MSVYLLFVEALETKLKLFIFGFHGFAQFLEDLREDGRSFSIRQTHVSSIKVIVK